MNEIGVNEMLIETVSCKQDENRVWSYDLKFLTLSLDDYPDEYPGRDEIRIEKLLHIDFKLIGNRSISDRLLNKGLRIN